MLTNILSQEGNIRSGEEVFSIEMQFNFNLCAYFEVKKNDQFLKYTQIMYLSEKDFIIDYK